MASPASVAHLGSPTRPCSPASALLASRRIQLISRVSFISSFDSSWRWHYTPGWLCRCMVTTNVIEEKSIQFSAEPTLASISSNDTTSSSSGRDDNDDLILKPPPKPVLNPRPNGSADGLLSAMPPGRRPERVVVDEEKKVIESLGEVLEKAEKLESMRPEKRVGNDKAAAASNGSTSAVGNPATATSPQPRTTQTLKSVWRKGNPVAKVEKVVRTAPPKTEVGKLSKDAPLAAGGAAATSSAPPVASAPKPTAPAQASPNSPPALQASPKPTPTLQASPKPTPPALQASPKPVPALRVKPSVTPPSPPAAAVSKTTDLPKERKTVLIDRHAGSKKPAAAAPAAASSAVVAPTAAAGVVELAPGKPQKGGPPPSKYKDDFRKKSGAGGGFRRRSGGDDADSYNLKLDVPIPGVAPTRRRGRRFSKASRRAARLQKEMDAAPVKVEILEVDEEGMSTDDLAYNLAVNVGEINGFLFSRGIKINNAQTLDKELVKMICQEYEVEVLEVDFRLEDMAKKKEILDEEDLDNLETRPPIITIMGHVDHGKTTLLDFIRKTKVVASEAGGITQGIGAYQVLVPVDGELQRCVFLDTPGHEAFGAMRARGARVTDIAIIVVAADDGVRPQTSEAIAHAKAAGVPIIIAINKIDKDGASPDRVMQELAEAGVVAEAWGGDTPMIQISALKGENVDELLENVMLVAELQELVANRHRKAKGTVIEASVDKSKGPIATVIVQKGTLHKGEILLSGEAFGKVRAMFDDRGVLVDEAGPSMAVQVVGLSNVPVAGEEFEVVDDLDTAREKAKERADSLRGELISSKAMEGKVTLSSIASSVARGRVSGLDTHQLNMILKVDFQGSIEAIRQAIQVLPQDSVALKFLLQAPGDVTISDVDLAIATEAVIFGFNVKSPGAVKTYAEKKNVEVRLYRVIYDLIDDLRKAMEGLLDPVEEKVPIGAAEVRAIFSSGSSKVAGCMVSEGKVVVDSGVQVVRKGRIVYTGQINSLRRVKEDVKEVGAGLECGIGVEGFNEWVVGDVIAAFNTVQKTRTLEEASATVKGALAKGGVRT